MPQSKNPYAIKEEDLTPDERETARNEETEAENLGLFDEPEPKPKAEKSKTPPKTVKKMAKGGKVGRGDGCCTKGHTKGRMV